MVISIEHISKRFGKLIVLNDLNLQLESGSSIALIGPNGCGKTTLIKMILGMVMPDKGRILVNATDIKGQYQYREHIGYMPQIGRYPDNMSVAEVIDTIKNMRGSSKALDMDLYNSFDTVSWKTKKMNTLSGGTRQKVSAILAFMFNPEILILDEPTAGLDPLSAEILKEKVKKEIAAGKLILITSHMLSELDEIISDVILLQDAGVKFRKTTSALKAEFGETRLSSAIARILKNEMHETDNPIRF